MKNMRKYLIIIYILLIIILPVYSQENNVLRLDFLGLSFDEIIEIEGEYDHYYMSHKNMGDDIYIREIWYRKKYFENYDSYLWVWFNQDGICNGYLYWVKMPENADNNNYKEILNSIYNNIINIYRMPPEIKEYGNNQIIVYDWTLDEINIRLTYNRSLKRIELSYIIIVKLGCEG